MWISLKVPLKFVPRGPFNNNPALVQLMAWRRPGDKPLSEPMLVFVPTHICVTRPQWVNPLRPDDTYMVGMIQTSLNHVRPDDGHVVEMIQTPHLIRWGLLMHLWRGWYTSLLYSMVIHNDRLTHWRLLMHIWPGRWTNTQDIATYFNSLFSSIGPKLANSIRQTKAHDYKKYLTHINNCSFPFKEPTPENVPEIINIFSVKI